MALRNLCKRLMSEAHSALSANPNSKMVLVSTEVLEEIQNELFSETLEELQDEKADPNTASLNS